jgi:hypothetical protein
VNINETTVYHTPYIINIKILQEILKIDEFEKSSIENVPLCKHLITATYE